MRFDGLAKDSAAEIPGAQARHTLVLTIVVGTDIIGSDGDNPQAGRHATASAPGRGGVLGPGPHYGAADPSFGSTVENRRSFAGPVQRTPHPARCPGRTH